MNRKQSRQARLRDIMARFQQEGASGIAGLLGRKAPAPAPAPSFKTVTVAQRWGQMLERIEHQLPDATFDPQVGQQSKLDVDQVYRSGEIHGTCLSRGFKHDVFVDCSGARPPAGCSCEVSKGVHPCAHATAFVHYLIDQLEVPESTLSRRVNKGDFSSDKPDRTRFEPNRDTEEMRKLDAALRLLPGVGSTLPAASALPEGNEFDLTPVTEIAVQRLVWNFSTDNSSFDLTPIVQQQKKRGDGFTKGRKISLENLRADTSLPLSDLDREIIQLINLHNDPYSYRFSLTIDAMTALAALINAPNVQFNDKPCEVRRLTFEIAVSSDNNDKWSLAIVDKDGKAIYGATVGCDGHFATLNADKSIICYGSLPTGLFKLIQMVMKFTPVGKEHLEALVDKARQIQKVHSVILPIAFAGPVVTQDATPVVALRSRPDGTLDYGIRIRDGGGTIRKPGSQPGITSEVVDGKPRQVRRDMMSELTQAAELAAKLGIVGSDTAQWNGSIQDFNQGLLFLEKLQSNDSSVEVLWDKASERPIKVLGSLTSKNVRVDITSKRNWFGISGQCDFGNHTMPLDELLQGLSGSGSNSAQGDYVRVGDGQWARISDSLRKRLTQLKDATHQDRKTLTLDATSAPVIRDLMNDDVEVKATKNWHECLARLSRSEKLEPVLPAGLRAELRDYQIDGYKWLRRLAEWGVGGVLADDMGLGKTLQTLAVLLDRASEGPALVIAPTSVGFNWVRETERFAPDLKVHLYRETDRQEFLGTIGPGDLVVCSYGLAMRDEAALSKVEWGTVVMDEAQAVKNSRSKTSQAIGNLNAKWIVALTGTPVENHLGELWSLFHLVSPGVFGGWENFRKRYALPIEKHADDEARMSLSTRLQPFILRRTKAEVLKELPPRTEMNLYVDLSPEERDQYDRIRLSAIGEVDQIASLSAVQDQRFKLLALLTRLRQFACHPGIVNKQWTGSSAKLDHLCQVLEDLKEEGHRALIFSQFTQHLALIRKALDERQITYEYLDGSTPAAARQQRVDDFQNGTANAFLISLKAGGTGLNLTAADYVIHMDPWWNPAVEDQATDRAHRIGQDKPVMVYRIIARGTIEEEILSLHDSKRDLVAGVLEGTTAAATFTTQDLLSMIRGS